MYFDIRYFFDRLLVYGTVTGTLGNAMIDQSV
jgi:hypothetical protein